MSRSKKFGNFILTQLYVYLFVTDKVGLIKKKLEFDRLQERSSLQVGLRMHQCWVHAFRQKFNFPLISVCLSQQILVYCFFVYPFLHHTHTHTRTHPSYIHIYTNARIHPKCNQKICQIALYFPCLAEQFVYFLKNLYKKKKERKKESCFLSIFSFSFFE